MFNIMLITTAFENNICEKIIVAFHYYVGKNVALYMHPHSSAMYIYEN